MKKLITLLTLVLIFTLSVSANNSGSFNLDVKEFILENGMKVLVLERHASPTVAVSITFRVGSTNEHLGTTGISHYVEHMMSKGTKIIGTKNYQKEKILIAEMEEIKNELVSLKKERSSQPKDQATKEDHDISNLNKRLSVLKKEVKNYRITGEITMIYNRFGARGLNATTSNERTWYHCELPSNKLELWAWLESDRISNPIWRDFEEEKLVILEERRWRNESNTVGTLRENFVALCYQAHPLRRPVIGWRSDIESITKKQLDKYYRQYYGPNNAIAVIVGDVETEYVMELMRKYFEPIPASKNHVPEITTIEPKQLGERRTEIELDAQPVLRIGYHTTKIGTKDDYTLDIVSEILSGGRTSRLYKKLVLEKELCTQIHAYNNAGKFPGLFGFYAMPKHPHTSKEVEEAIYQELELLKTEEVSDKEITNAKKRINAGFVMGLNSNAGLARMLGHYEVIASWKYVLNVNTERNKTNKEDIKEIIKKYFHKNNRVVASIISKKKEKE